MTDVFTNNAEPGVLLKDRASREHAAIPATEMPAGTLAESNAGGASHRLAFAGLFLFTLVLYLRPNDLFPGLLGAFPTAKLVGVFTLIVYAASKLSRGERLTIWPLEVKALAVIVALAVVHVPFAYSRANSFSLLADTFLKVAIVFALMVNLLDSRKRLYSILRLVVVCGTAVAVGTVATLGGKASEAGGRISGIVSGQFGNPNDMATALNILLPITVALALSRKGRVRLLYFACAAIIAFGVIISFSRAGFLGLLAMGVVLLWKVGRRNRIATALVFLLTAGIFVSALPSGYADRLFTILHTEKDGTGSAQERRVLLGQAIELAAKHVAFGVGMGNFSVYSINNRAAHNSYLEISAELSLAGLMAYLTLIFAPLRTLRRIENQTAFARAPRERETYYLSVGVQAAIVAYIVCSLFSSIEYYWYLYFPVAYAVSLRRIRECELAEKSGGGEGPPRPDEGVLWASQPGGL
ncbi:MAG TPA: O-antigen ligase family protein [Blastocatellia bacterium]|jgi:O-antigen ligase|nr:O-antigen ligase family protein [Blastocatellia bacterium]